MNGVASCIGDQRVRPLGENVEAPVKPVEPSAVERTKPAVKTRDPQEAVSKQRDKKLELCMENIKKFIRNIDVKSL
jgi:hypothetical protein